jgi:nucleoside diphosphate kinase
LSNHYSESSLVMCAAAKEAERKNTAFVFIKPHAVTEASKQMVAEGLKAKGLKIVTEGTLTAKQIDEGMLIDQHYYAIASKATLLKPNQLNVPPEKFKAKFGLEWKDALAKGVVMNAKDACEALGLDSAGLNAAWAKAKKSDKLIKFGGGFYCGLIDSVDGKPPLYVFNGFFMNMRNDYVKPGVSIYYYVVEWNSKKLAWEDFRGKVLGPTDPAEAPKDSMRGLFFKNWKSLGLAFEPNVGDNGIHASASPFEALAERMNWLGAKISSDDFGQQLVAAGVDEATIKEWSVDPVVTYGAASQPIKMSLFDSLEDTDSDMCLARAMMINMKKPSYDPVQIGAGVAVGAVLGALAGKA